MCVSILHRTQNDSNLQSQSSNSSKHMTYSKSKKCINEKKYTYQIIIATRHARTKVIKTTKPSKEALHKRSKITKHKKASKRTIVKLQWDLRHQSYPRWHVCKSILRKHRNQTEKYRTRVQMSKGLRHIPKVQIAKLKWDLRHHLFPRCHMCKTTLPSYRIKQRSNELEFKCQ